MSDLPLLPVASPDCADSPLPPDLILPTARIVAAFVAHQAIDADALPGLIGTIHDILARLCAPAAAADEGIMTARTGAVSVRRSLADPGRIISMIDGKAYSSLKRHIAAHGFTPDSYRAHFGLPASYPMIAPAYWQARSALAKKLGLVRKKTASGAVPSSAGPAKDAPMRGDETKPSDSRSGVDEVALPFSPPAIRP